MEVFCHLVIPNLSDQHGPVNQEMGVNGSKILEKVDALS